MRIAWKCQTACCFARRLPAPGRRRRLRQKRYEAHWRLLRELTATVFKTTKTAHCVWFGSCTRAFGLCLLNVMHMHTDCIVLCAIVRIPRRRGIAGCAHLHPAQRCVHVIKCRHVITWTDCGHCRMMIFWGSRRRVGVRGPVSVAIAIANDHIGHVTSYNVDVIEICFASRHNVDVSHIVSHISGP